MQLDSGAEVFAVPHSRFSLIGLFLLVGSTALTSSTLAIDVTPGLAVLDDHTAQLNGRAALDCFDGTLTDLSQVIVDVVAYFNPLTNRVYLVAVQGAEALTTAGATAPSDTVVGAALPSSSYPWARCGRVRFSRSGSVITVDYIDHTVRPLEVDPTKKDTAAAGAELEVVGADAAVYVFSHTQAFTVDAADIANGDLLTARPVPGFYGKIGGWRYVIEKAITTAAKTTTPNLEINTTNVTGSDGTAIAGAKALGVVGALGVPTAAHTFKPGDTWSIEAASTTAFVEGRIRFEVDFYRLISTPIGL